MTEHSAGTLLGGRLAYAQPVDGYRTGIEPVLLAACVPAQPGQRVLEAGTGAGAGLLCLLARVPGLHATGLELNPAMAELARLNLAANGSPAVIEVTDVAEARRFGPVDHAFANPPWHDPAGTLPRNGEIRLAKHRADSGLAAWVDGLATCVGRGGTLSLILPSEVLCDAVTLLAGAGFGHVAIGPLWPRAGRAAKLVLLQARRGKPATRLLPGLTLHGDEGFTPAAEAILRSGAPLPLLPASSARLRGTGTG